MLTNNACWMYVVLYIWILTSLHIALERHGWLGSFSQVWNCNKVSSYGSGKPHKVAWTNEIYNIGIRLLDSQFPLIFFRSQDCYYCCIVLFSLPCEYLIPNLLNCCSSPLAVALNKSNSFEYIMGTERKCEKISLLYLVFAKEKFG